MDWNFTNISGNYCPRQLEYHPSKNGLIFGTVSGEICAVDTTVPPNPSNPNSSYHIKSLGFYGKNKNDTMLGICWMRPQPHYGNAPVEDFFSSANNNSNLFVAGSSRGRVVLGDASKPFDPDNRDKYSILHDYPEFDRLTSVHLNSTNKLLLLSGCSHGVNIVDLETSQPLRNYVGIHQDHVNISRFSNLSPHLFATSSFDGTIKTWDLRQANAASSVDSSVASTAKPIYTVKCNSGVVMINFSSDDNFILASALDNEINQYMFLDGRKHLTYNLPKTGLKGNFTRAFYSGSGRYALTGACEENTVKIMCTYTGEMLSEIELYPGKKDKSICIQGLRGCPINDEQLCVLTNYRSLQTRELVMVTRNPDSPSLRAIAADSTLPAVLKDADEGSTADVGEKGGEAEAEQDFALLANNAFMHYYSSQYVEDMRSQSRFCGTLIDRHVATKRTAPGSMHLSLTTALDLSPGSNGKKHRCEIEDLVLLVHKASSAHSELNSLFLLPVHAYILKARCPALFELCLQSFATHSLVTASLRSTGDDASGTEILLPVADISDTLLGQNASSSCGLSGGVPSSVLFLLPLLVDYLYTGNRAFDLITLRFYCLQLFLKEKSVVGLSKAALFSSLIPHVGDFLRAEIYEYMASKTGKLSEEGDQEAYCVTQTFFALRGKAEVELLVKICVDDHCWRQSGVLAGAIVRVLQRLIELAKVVQLPAVRDVACSLLEQSMCPANAVAVFDTAVQHDCDVLRAACLQFISSHEDVLAAQIDAYPTIPAGESFSTLLSNPTCASKGSDFAANVLSKAVQALTTERSVKVISRSEFRSHKLHDEIRIKSAACGSDGVPQSDIFGPGGLSPGRSRQCEEDLRWMMEESPFLPGTEATPAGICLSRHFSATATPMFDHSMIFLGGQNFDRVHSLSNRILTYNYVKNEYKYVSCGGTHVPKSAVMISAGALQKCNPTHLLALGGMLEKAEISMKPTTLPQHLRALSSSLGEVLAPDAEKTPGRGVHVVSSGPTSLVHNRMMDVWNLNEELSPPAGAAGDMGIIFELDYRTLTWRSPSVKYVTATTHSTTQALQRQHEMLQLRQALKQRIGQSIACLYHEDVQYRCQQCLFAAHPSVMCNCDPSGAKKRAVGSTWMVQFAGFCNRAQAIMSDVHVLTAEPKPSTVGSDPRDVEYEYTWAKTVPSGEAPLGRLSHACAVVPFVPTSRAAERSPEHLLHAYTRVLIFGGQGYNNELMGGVASLRINHSSPGAHNSLHRSATSSEYSHYAHWEDVSQEGPSPSTRQGHTMVHLPETNMIVLFGGFQTSGPGAYSCSGDVWIMRLIGAELQEESSGFTELRISWTNIAVGGIPPSLRSRHTAFAVPKRSSYTYNSSMERLQGVMFVFGGIDDGKNQQRMARGDQAGVDFDEEQKDSVMHTMHVMSPPTYVPFVSSVVEDRVISASEWLTAPSPFARETAPNACLLGRFLHFASEISVPMPACSLSRDMLLLLDPIFSTALSDSTEVSQAKGQLQRLHKIARDFFAHRGVAAPSAPIEDVGPLAPRLKINVIGSNEQVTNVSLYYSLLCRRCEWFNIVLTSEMQGAGDAQVTELFGTDPVAFHLLLMFIYADALMICSMQDVVAVLELANQYDLIFLAQRCEAVLVRLITLDNLCELLDYSDTLNLDTLRAACTAVFLRDVIGVYHESALLAQFFPERDVAEAVMTKPAQGATPQGTDCSSHRALDVSRDAAVRAELVSGFARLSPELRSDLWLRITQSVHVFASSDGSMP